MRKKKVAAKKEERKPFSITSLSAVGAKSIVKIYEKMGYKLVSSKYDSKKEVHINTFK